ncbi:unnamed protein product [Caenorhabditis angaria]|uniref:Nudix hydrolase domain-containing protein n=1 Tax=Caenorhabditis angaria TaxID=860376 RepID=A0A9P1I8D4_9PELO|nr:unnamed protein product [Caenorhabditis angaria]
MDDTWKNNNLSSRDTLESRRKIEKIRKCLGLLDEFTRPEGEKDAGVLILLDIFSKSEPQVLLCVRSANLRRHPGEVCFPGGMMDELADDGNTRQTAIRETQEEIGVPPEDYEIIGNLPAFRARFGILLHPTIAVVKNPLKITMNPDEVQSVFWIPISRFLSAENHSIFQLDQIYYVHMFQFPDFPTTFGVTALMCIIVAMGVFGRQPNFDILANLPEIEARQMSTIQILTHVYRFAGRKFERNSKI